MSQLAWRRASPMDSCSSFHSKLFNWRFQWQWERSHSPCQSELVGCGIFCLFVCFLRGVWLLNEMWITVWQHRYSLHRGHSIKDRGDEHRKENPGDTVNHDIVPEFYVNWTACFLHLWVCSFLGEERVQKLDSSKPTESLQSFTLNY